MLTKEQRERFDELVERRFNEFGTRRHWRITRDAGGTEPHIAAQRRFRYRSGAEAVLCVQHALDVSRVAHHVEHPLDTRRLWDAGLFLPFAEGKQGGICDKRIEPVLDWALLAEQVLTLPLDLERAWTGTERDKVIRSIDRLHAWPSICLVFDIDYWKLGRTDYIELLVAKQCPEPVS